MRDLQGGQKQEKVVILCGGEGTRLREETETKPKPMIPIGGKPLLWHIMKYYASYGYSDFVLCLGYRGDIIKDYFSEAVRAAEGWGITFADTGLKTQTGARIKRVETQVGGGRFLATYGDGLSDVDLRSLAAFHAQKGTAATLTAVRPHSKWGVIKADSNGIVVDFAEKPPVEHFVNGGFFVFENRIFDYLDDSEGYTLETTAFSRLVAARQLSMWPHSGFWHAIDTYKEYMELNDRWRRGDVPWKRW